MALAAGAPLPQGHVQHEGRQDIHRNDRAVQDAGWGFSRADPRIGGERPGHLVPVGEPHPGVGVPHYVGRREVGLGVVAVAVVLVPRMFRVGQKVRWRARLAQALAVLLCAALAMLSAGIWLNRSFVFYGSWADVFDGSGMHLSTRLYGSAAGSGHLAGVATGRDPEDPGAAVPLTRTQLCRAVPRGRPRSHASC